MYIVAIGWIYVALMMAVVEATSTTGTLLGALVTFVLYGALPVGLVLYLMATPARKRRIKARQAAERAAYLASLQPDGSSQPSADPVAPVGKEP